MEKGHIFQEINRVSDGVSCKGGGPGETDD